MSAKIQTAARYVNRHSRRSTLAGTTEEVNGDGVSAWSGLSRDTDDYDSRWTLSGKAAAASPPSAGATGPTINHKHITTATIQRTQPATAILLELCHVITRLGFVDRILTMHQSDDDCE